MTGDVQGEAGPIVDKSQAGERGSFDEERFRRAYLVAMRVLHWDEVTAFYPSNNFDGNPEYLQAYNALVGSVIAAVQRLEERGVVPTIPAEVSTPPMPPGEPQ